MVHSARSMAYGHSRFRGPVRPAGILLRVVSVVLIVVAAYAAASAGSSAPLRAFWIAPSAMTSPTNIQRAIASAASGGFDAVIAPLAIGVRSDADSFAAGAELLRQARERGLAAHLSITVNVAAPVGELPASREHVIYQHPEWLMVPRQLAAEMLKIDIRSPAYLGQIARWTRANADRVEGVYVSPLDPAAASYLVDAITTAARRYAVEGLYLEALDFPGDDFDYSRHALDLFRTRMRPLLSSTERARLDEVEAIDPFAYPEEFPAEWRTFRESSLTDVLERLHTALAAVRPTMSIAAALGEDADSSPKERFQAWRTWLARGIVDRVGYRSRATGAVLLSPDGVFASTPVAPPAAQAAAGTGGPR
jgi:uncharacterized lipoprotein YddW (UPF0748 family)